MLRSPHRDGARNFTSAQTANRSARLRAQQYSDAKWVLATCLMAALTYVLTTWLLLSITYVEPVEQESIVDFSVAAEASGLDDRVPLDWVGKRIEVFWPRNALWYRATVTHYDGARKMHLIQYDEDGAVERLDLDDLANVRLFYGPEWIGRAIEILYQNGRWYTANVVAMTQDGSHVVHFPDDNSREIVNLHSIKMRIPEGAQSGTNSRDTNGGNTPQRGKKAPTIALEGKSIDLFQSTDNSWLHATVLAYDSESGNHSLRLHGQDTPISILLSAETYSFSYGKELVGKTIRVFWAEYNNWFIGSGLNSRYEANVDCYEELTQKHCLRYVDDNSTETLSLRQQQILILHNEDLVGRFISLYNETTEEWHRSLKVIYYDEPHKTHVILEPNTGNINSLHLEWYTIQIQHGNDNSTSTT